MTYHYFCGNCGKHFASEKPERDSKGYLNEIPCPSCGAHDTYPDTPSGAAKSVADQIEYEDRLIEQREDTD